MFLFVERSEKVNLAATVASSSETIGFTLTGFNRFGFDGVMVVYL